MRLQDCDRAGPVALAVLVVFAWWSGRRRLKRRLPFIVRIAPASAQVAAGGTVDVAVEVVDVQ